MGVAQRRSIRWSRPIASTKSATVAPAGPCMGARKAGMSLHVATDHCGVEDVHRGEQRRCAVPLIVVRHGSGAVLFQRQSGLGSVDGLNWRIRCGCKPWVRQMR
jgi:hypothetical protein